MATPRPSSDSASSSGCFGLATCLPSSDSGGARSAEEVAAQIRVSARKITGEAPGAANGRARKAAQETSVAASSQPPMPPTARDTLSAATPLA